MLRINCLKWRAKLDELAWKTWTGDKYVVFNGAVSETHYMDVFSLHILRLLGDTERSEADMVTALSDDLGAELEDHDLREVVSRTVNSLAQSGLINRT